MKFLPAKRNYTIAFFTDFQRSCIKNRRHSKEIRTTYMAISIITSFAVLNFPRFIATMIEVFNTNLIIRCIENEVRYLPTIEFYRLDYFARMLMVLNSAINFLIYCAVSTPFKVNMLVISGFFPCVHLRSKIQQKVSIEEFLLGITKFLKTFFH